MSKTEDRVMETYHYEPQIKTKKKTTDGVIRVAAYCRVSTLSEEQELSFSSQCAYYKDLIEKDPNMKLVGVYGDQGCSGLHADKRPQFQEMIKACLAGEVDEVMVKSISRFARNSIDCQRYLELLKGKGVRVFFEKERLYSDNPQCELVLKLMSSVAQESSNSLSTSMRWSLYHNNELGNPSRVCSYGYKKLPRDKGQTKHIWVIDEDKAERVRLAFKLADEGMKISKIAKRLSEIEAKAGSDKKWNYQNVKALFNNETYRGDILTSKTVVPDYITGKAVKNEGVVPQYYIEEHHEPIVEPELYDRVNKRFYGGK